MKLVYNDGGRAAAGFKGVTRDCVCRAIAIACERPYQEVYDVLNERAKVYRDKENAKGKGRTRTTSARTGIPRAVYEPLLREWGWEWKPTMLFGQGCKVHLKESELPGGRIIVSLSRHLATVIDGVLHDTYIEDRDGTRCVYGYFWKPI